MTEWWTYGLSDFLMFSPQVYWRLVERHNLAVWPAQAIALLAGAAIAWAARSAAASLQRGALLLLALAWAWVGWRFAWLRYAEIFLGGPYLAAACGVQAALLAAGSALPPQRPTGSGEARAGPVLVLAAVLVYPLLAPLEGHPWAQAEVFGVMPDPTALATLGLLLAARALPHWLRVLLAPLPLAVLLLGVATRWALWSQ